MKKTLDWFKGLFGHRPGKNAKLGWKRDLPDPRDFKFKITSPYSISKLLLSELPPTIDLRNACPNVYDQGNLGSCGANAMGAAFQFEQKKQGIQDFMPSRLFIYYNTRVLEGTVNSDAGVTLRNVMKTMVDTGVCPEKMWRYGKCFKKKPSNECYVEAMKHQVLEYLRVTHLLSEIKICLADGNPIVFGMMLYESFMSDDVTNSGKVPMPNLSSESAIGGHAVMAVGYDDSKNVLIVRNSWGYGWGDRGYFYLPYEYVNTPNLTADYWTIKLVENGVSSKK
jgi:C1A family cysteine protease